jgi:transcriptional regulator with XRE-family HTH domain
MSSSQAANTLREARTRSGLSQRDLAKLANTSQSVVGRIEAGLTSPSFDSLARLLDAAGYALSVTIVAKPVRDPVIEAYKPGIDQTLLIENLRKTPDQRIQTLVAMQTFHEELRRGMREAQERRAAASAPATGEPGRP